MNSRETPQSFPPFGSPGFIHPRDLPSFNPFQEDEPDWRPNSQIGDPPKNAVGSLNHVAIYPCLGDQNKQQIYGSFKGLTQQWIVWVGNLMTPESQTLFIFSVFALKDYDSESTLYDLLGVKLDKASVGYRLQISLVVTWPYLQLEKIIPLVRWEKDEGQWRSYPLNDSIELDRYWQVFQAGGNEAEGFGNWRVFFSII